MAHCVDVMKCLEELESYYEECGSKMQGNAKKLNEQFEKEKIAQIIKRIRVNKQSEFENKTMWNFIHQFKNHYLGNSNARGRAQKLAKEFKFDKSVFDSFLKSLSDWDSAKAIGVATASPNSKPPPHGKVVRNAETSHLTGDPEAKRQAAELKRRNEELESHIKAKDQVIRDKDKQIEDYSNRLSAEMNAKISANESHLENISVQNRPMNVSEQYQSVFSTEWNDAKSALDKAWKTEEKHKSKYLCDLVLKAYDCCGQIKEGLTVYLQEPVSGWTQRGHDMKAAGTLNPGLLKVMDTVLDYWKVKGSAFQVPGDILQEIIKGVSKEKKVPSTPDLPVYVEAVFKLCWNMVLQKPPMTLDTSGVGEKWRGEKWQDIAWGSKDPTKGKVQCYIYPTLKHGDQIMVRGKVLIL